MTEWKEAKKSLQKALNGPWTGSLEEADFLNTKMSEISLVLERYDTLAKV